MKLLLLELDETLITPRNEEHTYIHGVSDIWMKGYVYEKLRYYKDRGWALVVMTNQPLIAAGKRTVDDVYALFYATNHLLGNIFDGFLICPDDPNGVVERYKRNSACYRSKDGLMTLLYAELNIREIDIEECMVISHREADQTFAASNGFKYRHPSEFF